MKPHILLAFALSVIALIASLVGVVMAIAQVVRGVEEALITLGITLLGLGASGLVLLAIIRVEQRRRYRAQQPEQDSP